MKAFGKKKRIKKYENKNSAMMQWCIDLLGLRPQNIK